MRHGVAIGLPAGVMRPGASKGVCNRSGIRQQLLRGKIGTSNGRCTQPIPRIVRRFRGHITMLRLIAAPDATRLVALRVPQLPRQAGSVGSLP